MPKQLQKLSKDIWYSLTRLLSHNAFISMCMSPRGNGKSYDAKKLMIKNWQKKGKQSVYIRRYKRELEDMKDTFWDDIMQEFPEYEFSIKGFVGYINDKPVVYFEALTTSSTLRSKAFPNVNLIVFDEYIIVSSSYNRYLRNEMTLFFDMLETIFRIRDDGRVILLGNSVSYVNPFFSFFDIVPNPDKRFQKFKDGLICLELFTSNKFIEEKKKTQLGRLVDQTDYGKYAIENVTLEDNTEFIKDRESHNYKFMCMFKYDIFKIGVWYDLDADEYFCDERIDANSPHKYAMRLEELEEGYFYYKNYREITYRIRDVREAGARGNIYFESQEIKKIMQDRILPFI